MKALNWNIKSGGSDRIGDITLQVQRGNHDVVIITEFRSNSAGAALIRSLAGVGLNHVEFSSSDQNKNGVALFSRHKISLVPSNFSYPENVFSVRTYGVLFLCAFCADDVVTHATFADLERRPISEDSIIVGDLNTGPRGSVPDRYHDLDRLTRLGYIDSWRAVGNPIFWSFRSGRGASQPDHVLYYSKVVDFVDRVAYDDSVISAGLSDHAMMTFEFVAKGAEVA